MDLTVTTSKGGYSHYWIGDVPGLRIYVATMRETADHHVLVATNGFLPTLTLYSPTSEDIFALLDRAAEYAQAEHAKMVIELD